MTHFLPSIFNGKRRFFVLVFLALLGGGVWYFKIVQGADGGSARDRHAHDLAAVPVVAVAAHKGTMDVARQALGTVTPMANVTVRTQISGQLQEVAFQEGQMVQKGEYLAQIDPRPYQTALEQAEGALQRDQALLKDAQLNLARYKKLVTQDSISKQQVDTQAALVEQYAGAVLSDQGQIDSAKLNLTYCHITSPVAGRVGLRQVDQGNYVQVSDANGLVTVTQVQPIDVMFTLPEDDIPAVMKRLDNGAQLPVTVYDRANTTKLAEGTLVAIDNSVNTSTGTVKFRAAFDNAEKNLFPNQFVNVDLLVDSLQGVVIVPSAAVLRGTAGTFVYVVKDDSTVTIKPVKTGVAYHDQTAILEGLAENDQVVTSGTDKLRDGMAVSLPRAQEVPQKGASPPTP